MSTGTFFWHDYETFGADPRRDRPSQFAGVRTTLDLEIVGEPLQLYCQPPRDVLPHPEACLLTGITPQTAAREGVLETEFAARIHAALAEPGTCGVGYNSLRFDDEVTRHLLYRNFHDPYAREWEHGNSRWDLIDLLRLCYALRPDGVQWPLREDGVPSFRLGDLTTANHLVHANAHDALSDVHATIALARLIRIRQPRLFNYFFELRRKQKVFGLLDYTHMTPLLHASSRYPASRGCLAMIAPLSAHPTQPNGVIVIDLDADPTDLIELDAEDIADRVFTPRADLPEDVIRIPLKTVHANRSPALAPLSALNGVDLARIQLDPERCQRHLLMLREADGIAEKVRKVFAAATPFDAAIDPELALYAGFPGDADKRSMREVRHLPPQLLAAQAPLFRDTRYTELLFRYRARNFPDTLNPAERKRWFAFRQIRLTTQSPGTTLTLTDYFAIIAAHRENADLPSSQHAVLDALDAWGQELSREIT